MKISFKLICVLVLLVVQLSQGREPAELNRKIDSLASLHLQKTKGAGFYLAYSYAGEDYTRYYQNSEADIKHPADSNSLFEIGPLSTVFTTLLFAKMSIEGEISLDDPLQKFLPFGIIAPIYQKIICKPVNDPGLDRQSRDEPGVRFTPYVCLPDAESRAQPILLCYLATHTSGLPAYPDNMHAGKNSNMAYSAYSKSDLYDFLKNYKLPEPIGYDYHYSELGISVLGHVLELQSGMSFDSLMFSKLLLPLKLNHTGFVPHAPENSDTKMQGRLYDVFAPAGGIVTDIHDMQRFMKMNIGLLSTGWKDVLDYTHNPRILIEHSGIGVEEIALGWRVSKLTEDGLKVVWQGGSTEKFSSFMGFEESTKKGVLILSDSSVPVHDLGVSVLQLLTAE